LFVGTKKQAKDVVESEAKRAGMYYVTNRWLGGMLTNYQTVKASIDRFKKLESLKNSSEWNETPKKMQSKYDRELSKLHKSLGGIQDMKKLPGALFIIDTVKEHIAVKEAKRLGIPVVAVVDTNCNPLDITHVIPGNDDAMRSVTLFARLIADSCLEGGRIHQEKLRAADARAAGEDDDSNEKKVSRFEGDIDLRGVDEADIAAMEEPAEGEEVAAVATEEKTEAKKS
jgi:small subunit ribosomal protein S2